jgi:tetratricopeptide (TPR) repeat protein
MKMKRINPLALWSTCICALLLVSCGTSTISFQILKPAQISFPSSIKTILVINRYRPTQENKLGNIIEGILTGERPFVDKQGAENAVAGLANYLAQSPRFTIVRANEELKGTGTGWFPEPLPQSTIVALCKKYNADALVALEAFDSDKSTTFQKQERSKAENGTINKYNVSVAKRNMHVTVGWRVYEAANANLLDEYRMDAQNYWNGEGANDQLAAANLPDDYFMVKNVGLNAGQTYAARIAPEWQWIQRTFYKKGDDAMKEAEYLMRAGKIDEAISKWKGLLNHPEKKVAGRAAYNIAVGYEYKGDLALAMEWAKKALGNYQLTAAENYMQLLQERIAEEQKLKMQMNK